MAGYQFDGVLVHITYGMDDNSTNIYSSDIPLWLGSGIDFLKANTEKLLKQSDVGKKLHHARRTL